MRRGAGVLVAAALVLEEKQLPKAWVWACQQRPRDPHPHPRGRGSGWLMSRSLTWGPGFLPLPGNKFQGNAAMFRVSEDEPHKEREGPEGVGGAQERRA